MLEKLDKNLRGLTAEYLVAGEICKRGFIASLTRKNVKGIDILASNSDASKSVGIQVKSTIYPREKYPAWILNYKADDYKSDNLFYVFVLIKDNNERCDFYIVPSKDVADYTTSHHQAYLERGKSKGKEYHSDMRKFRDPECKYLEKWYLLGL